MFISEFRLIPLAATRWCEVSMRPFLAVLGGASGRRLGAPFAMAACRA